MDQKFADNTAEANR